MRPMKVVDVSSSISPMHPQGPLPPRLVQYFGRNTDPAEQLT